MDLEIQIQSIFFSFVYGMFSSLLFNVLHKALYSCNRIIRLISNFIFILFIFSLYFYLLYLINCGVVHIYFVILFILGFIIGNYKTKKIRFVLKKSR